MKKDYNFGYTKVNSKQKTKLVQNVFSSVAPSYDIMNDLMSLGMHRLWKKRFVETVDLKENEIILDVGSGSGDIASEILKENLSTSLYLLDLNEEMLLEGRKRLKKEKNIKYFIGNAEGRDILSGKFDVIVCDGFVGNVLLKFAEAVGDVVLQIMHEELPQGWRGLLGTFILKSNLKKLKQRIDHAEHGGGLLLGVAGICIISHGSSRAPSIFNAIRLAKEAIDHKVLEQINSYGDKLIPESPN